MSARWIGAHMPTSGGLRLALQRGREIGCTAVQVFTSSPQQWKAKPMADEAVERFQQAQAATGIDCVVSHDSYLVNLCATNDEIRAKSIEGLKAEVERCARLGIRWVVSHMGSHLGAGEEAGLQAVAEGARRVFEETSDSVTLLMETTAGQGSALNYRFEHLATLIESLQGHPRLGVCLDTCHLFAAGYDLRDRESYEATFSELERWVGLDRVKAIHANDSKKGLGSRVDRHAHIGEGEIGIEAFRLLVNDPRWIEVPILLETPDAETMHKVNLECLKSLLDPVP
ncbi:MAG: putative endonuclease 4 [Chthonomonadaceae bacterium]|uniref:Probable endonuclease 4 n=1 Tax=Candidatus Nitrosymbiomonas proteolyticus TaxID=2608984 RepID=A0A809R784_9BACT|nr:deoxyribonuclease IV [Candidatus Nitrosymbiomonas proteolyticus]